MAKVIVPTYEFVREHLRYDPDTGEFFWLKTSGGRRTTPGFIHQDRYLVITINRKWYQAHRLAWLLMTKEWPTDHVNHINGNGFDNRWSNLCLDIKHREFLTQTSIRHKLSYNPETGHLYRKTPPNHTRPAGTHAGNGYVYIYVFGKNYLAHRLIWLWMTGEWPLGEIDHINGIRDDNTWSNLRDVTRRQNILNCGVRAYNTSGFTGVQKCRKRWKAVASYREAGKQITRHIGMFDTPEDAHKAYKAWLTARGDK